MTDSSHTADVLRPARLEDVRLEGPVGEEIQRVIGARMLSRTARDEIVPEAVQAFRNRVDDRLQPGRGLWQGEFWGKWALSAVAAWRYTGSSELLDLIRASTADLIHTRRGDGYIGTYDDSTFVVGDTWNVWCRKYTLWGLLEAYQALGDEQVLEAAAGMMDHLMTEVGPGRTDIVRTGNFRGLPSSSILTPVLELYRLTGESRYLEYGTYITEQWSRFPGQPPDLIRRGLTGDPVHTWFPQAGAWTKAYELISCVEGLLHLYRLTGQSEHLEDARRIHRAIREHERVVTGGIGYDDKLCGAAALPDGLNELCDVVYWERLNLELLLLTGEPQYGDEIERLAWNALMGAVNRDGSWALRRLGLSEPHLIAVTHCQLRHHHCCVANIPRGLLQLAQSAVLSATQTDALAVNLFLPGTFRMRLASGAAVELEIRTDYPFSAGAATVRLRVHTEQPHAFSLRLRIPPWGRDCRVSVAGSAHTSAPPAGAWLSLSRTWRDSDAVEVDIPLRGRLLRLPGGGEYCAVARGPLVLARSTMLGDPDDIHAPVSLASAAPPSTPEPQAAGGIRRQRGNPKDGAGHTDAEIEIPLEEVCPPHGVRLAARIDGKEARGPTLCDYASTGKDFQHPPADMPWEQMVDNRTPHPLRVWIEVPVPPS